MFNNKQEEAITCRDRFIFVNAGAGSGKTTVMIARIQSLLREGVQENQILGLTFSKEAADQMKHRLNNENVHISTFHSFCYQHLNNQKIFYSSQRFHQDFLLKVSLYKNHLINKPLGYNTYQKHLKSHDWIDYDDMLIEFLKLKKTPNFLHILIDEFQDTNYLQMQVLFKLMKANTHIFSVGDPDQSIYRFRGAMPSVIYDFIKIYNAKVLTLDMNYRSDHTIIKIANQLISNNKNRLKKNLQSASSLMGHIEILLFNDDKEYLNHTLKIISTSSFKSYAILARTNQQLFDLKYTVHENLTMFLQKKVSLLTLHEAKGLEFDIVFILGIDEKTMPHDKAQSKESIEEERRLLYVGITRAKHQLYFIHIKKRDQYKNVKLSKFMLEISQNHQFKAIK
jgi:DNA helicase II / ATP-dependent DNA helicase PcrA